MNMPLPQRIRATYTNVAGHNLIDSPIPCRIVYLILRHSNYCLQRLWSDLMLNELNGNRSIPKIKVHGTHMGLTGADRTHVGPMWAPRTLLSGISQKLRNYFRRGTGNIINSVHTLLFHLDNIIQNIFSMVTCASFPSRYICVQHC